MAYSDANWCIYLIVLETIQGGHAGLGAHGHSVWIGPVGPHIHLLSAEHGQNPTDGTLNGKSEYLVLSLIDGLAFNCN